MKNLIKYLLLFIIINTSNAQYVIHHEILDTGTLYAFTLSEDQQYCIFAATTQVQRQNPPEPPVEYSNWKLKKVVITIIKTDLNFNVIEARSFIPTFCGYPNPCNNPSFCDSCMHDIEIYDIIEYESYYYLCGKREDTAFLVMIPYSLSSPVYYYFSGAKSFNSLCARGDEIFVVGQSNDNTGCCYRMNKNNPNMGYGYKTIEADWNFHKVINTGDKIILSGVRGNSMTGFVSINPNNTIYASTQFQNTGSKAVLTKCPGNNDGFIIATSEANQIRSFIFNGAVFEAGILYTNSDGSSMSLQDINNSSNKIAWVGINDLNNCFYISSNFNYNSMPQPFINPPFFNRYLANEDEFLLYKTHYSTQQNQFYCGGYSNDRSMRVRETFCAVPEIPGNCDDINILNFEDIFIFELDSIPLTTNIIYKEYEINNFEFDFVLSYTKTCEPFEATPQKMGNAIYQIETKRIKVHVLEDIIKVENISENVDYIIFSIDGKKITEGKLNSNLISIQNLSRGIYLLQIRGKDFNVTEKIIK